ncbi:MAG: D-hexose-6-phosphate mutarotase [Gammaproteobacteria bacterium]|nr:D-hexose-6-phosphate mutarotase [Gammaproteobacteria bacterium]
MDSLIQHLNNQFGIAGHLKITQKNPQFAFIEVHSSLATAVVSLYGGHVLEFKPVDQNEQLLFVSNQALYQTGKAIRGGIPVCWPWFGAAPDSTGPAHGLVRTRPWQLRKTALADDGSIDITLGIQDDAETRKIWNHRFDLSLVITINQTLSLQLITYNTGNSEFKLTQALHSYFLVGDSRSVQIKGLENLSYIDKTDDGQLKQQQGCVSISEETDRVFNTESEPRLTLLDPSLSRSTDIQSNNCRTAVVWNPWKHKSESMKDLGHSDYMRFVCIETANAGNNVIHVKPDSKFSLFAQYRVI